MAFLTTELSDSLTEEHLEKLNKANIWTINDFCSIDLMDIKRQTSIKYHILKELNDKVKQRYTLNNHEFNYYFAKCRQEYICCPTGIPELTYALDSGYQTQEIVEFSGDSECGKTEMCYLICGEILSHYNDYQILYIASDFDFDVDKITKYIKSKAANRELTDEDIFNCLKRVEVAKLTKLADLVHLLNTFVHTDKRNKIKCIIIDSISFIIQEDLLDIRSFNLSDGDAVEKFAALNTLYHHESKTSTEGTRKDFIDIYVHELMRLLTNIAITKNVILVITNSDKQLTYCKSYTNAIDHRIQLTKMSEHSLYSLRNSGSTVCKATILKTIHNVSKIGYSIPFSINDEGLFAIRLTSTITDSKSPNSDTTKDDYKPNHVKNDRKRNDAEHN